MIVDRTFTGDPIDRRRLAECADCRWWLTPVCWRDPRNADAGCRVVATCPRGWVAMSIWFASAHTAARIVGRYCLGPAGPVTPGRISSALAGRFVQRLPGLNPGKQPTVSITGLATLFRTGQPVSAGPWRYSVVGFVVSLAATTSWTWTFGDGASLVTRLPGGLYPVRTVSHIYRRGGTYRVAVRSEWSGTYTVEGMGPFDIAPPVSQSAVMTVVVRQARAILIDPALATSNPKPVG